LNGCQGFLRFTIVHEGANIKLVFFYTEEHVQKWNKYIPLREIYADENEDPGPGTAQPSPLIIGTPMTIEK
jgi:hypothetical protein